MNPMIDLKWRVRFFSGISPRFFYPAYQAYYHCNYRKIHEIDRFTRENTGITIEGFPRSANSSTVTHFHSFNPGVKISHHHHVPAQVIRAIELGIPALVLIRDPEEAISSLKCLEPQLPLETAIGGYLSFYETLLPFTEHFAIASFESLFERFDEIIDRVNWKFDTHFSIGTPLKRLKTSRDAKIPHINRLRQKPYRASMRSAFDLYETYLALEQKVRQRSGSF